MTETITVGLGDRSYRILFGADILGDIGTVCSSLPLGKVAAVVTNSLVASYYFPAVASSLTAAGFSVYRIEIGDGEEYKNLTTLGFIYDRLVDAGLDRGAFILALGGGVVGDIAGHAAATYLRGIPFVQVPTTLLAQVDSSVGGKTGINHDKGKNLIGSFYQPALVVVDISTLSTLAPREYLCGLAEAVKYGIVLDPDFFSFLESNVPRILDRDPRVLLTITTTCCKLKARVVEQDEKELGLRAVLNYGHTLGHAVETLTNYSRYKHGEAVAIGMVLAAKFSEHLGYSGEVETGRIFSLLTALGLPVEAPEFSAENYREALVHDKKMRDGGITFICNKGIGDFHFAAVKDLDNLIRACGIGG